MKFLPLITLVILVGTALHGCASSEVTNFTTADVIHAIDVARVQLKASMDELGDSLRIPRSTGADGHWNTVAPRDWTSGFFPGCLWYMYQCSTDPDFKAGAEQWTERVRDQQYLTTTHDVGFIIMSSFGNGYRVTHNDSYVPVILTAAQSLMSRYNETVGCIRSWDNRKWGYPVIIDNMMNLELLFWASKHGGTKQMYDAAFSHALITMKNHVRPDGSTYHVVDYDTLDGSVVARETHQGYANESVWARGQAWAIYGFTMAYGETKDQRLLETAERTARWFIGHLPEDHIPYWDFSAPDILNEPKDASAAAIAASGLLELSALVEDERSSLFYLEAATAILRSLSSPPYLAEGTSSRGILRHAVGNYPKKLEVDCSLIYGDYYFLEGLSRYEHHLSTRHATAAEEHGGVRP